MADFDVIKLTLGALQTNCYILALENGGAAVIDPADNAAEILSVLDENKLTLKKILLTHGHFDHTGACVELRKRTGAEISLHEKDAELLADGEKALAFFEPRLVYKPFEADTLLSDGDVVDIDGVKLTVMLTAGHTRGSVCYIAENHAFVGDTVFAGSVGRTDCYGGNFKEQCESLRRLSSLRGEYILHTGHGEDTTLYDEVTFNPFFVKYTR